MKTISINGVIGYDIFPTQIKAQLNEAKGSPVTVEINSIGGLVSAAIEIYNMLRNYSGKVTTRAVGYVMSAASYIFEAAEKPNRIVEDNAVWMMHNAKTSVQGDHREMRRQADLGEALTNILARAYVQASGIEMKEIRAMLDAETYLYGEEIVAAGFADSVAQSGKQSDKNESMSIARVEAMNCKNLVSELETEKDMEHAVAMYGDMPTTQEAPTQQPTNSASPEALNKSTGVQKRMTLDELKVQHPELFASAYNQGQAAGAEQEKNRVAKLSAWKRHNPMTAQICDEAIASGKSCDDVMPEIMAALATGQGSTATAAAEQADIKAVSSTAPNATATGQPAEKQVEIMTDDFLASLHANTKHMTERFS